jgi:inorganic pyrophosphatase
MALDPALDLLFKAHPWHGVSIGAEAPQRVTVFIEIVPSDTVKYELDKDSGLLKVDRPQLYSNVCPAPYGFVPCEVIRRSQKDYAARFGSQLGPRVGRG